MQCCAYIQLLLVEEVINNLTSSQMRVSRSGSRFVLSTPAWLVGEFFGTFLVVFFGCGSVCAATTTGAQFGAFQVAIIWGLGIATAIHLCGALSGAHLNPAVTVSMAVWTRFVSFRQECVNGWLLGM